MTRAEFLGSQLPAGSCALITSDINRRYFTGMKSSAGAVLIFPDYACLIIDFRYFEKASAVVTDCEVIKQDKLTCQINDIAAAHGAQSIMIESETVTVAELARLSDKLRLPVDSSGTLSGIIGKMRQIKSEDELNLMIKAQRIAEAALEKTLDFIREGVTERETALFLNNAMLTMGAEDISFETIALFGENTSMPHGTPTDRTLKRGEPVLMDFGAVCDGYHSDMTRTVVLGEPSEELAKVYDIVLRAQEKALKTARAGISCKLLDGIARDFISENGYGGAFGHGLGHSVGLEIHEPPAANTRDDTVLQENMIMTVEPGIYLPKKFGVRIEDFVVIKQNSAYNLTNAPKNLIKL